MKAILLCQEDHWRRVYGPGQLARLSELAGLAPRAYTLAQAAADDGAREVELIFSTWGMPAPGEDEIARLFPRLRAVFYAAGSVQGFARPFLARGVRVLSAWRANGVPVAEYTLAQILLASKGYFLAQAAMRTARAGAAAIAARHPGMFGVRVGLLGVGAIGSMVAERLKGFDCEVWAFDPFAPDEALAALNVRRASMERIFAQCDIVSNHLANLPSTRGIIKREHLLSMRDHATFINTGRGAQLDERDLYDMLAAKPGATALLDVLADEHRSDDNPLVRLPNCFFTPHIAGSMGNEVMRMAEYMIDECGRYLAGQPLRHEVTPAMLDTMA
ncbi:MAG: hydroxyacid dehydrogenase [Clostridiales bacterium]|nr:hydroxyacid dehydrogenase [Clostridiales bacterium]